MEWDLLKDLVKANKEFERILSKYEQQISNHALLPYTEEISREYRRMIQQLTRALTE